MAKARLLPNHDDAAKEITEQDDVNVGSSIISF